MEALKSKNPSWIWPFGICFLLAWIWAFRDVYFYNEVLLPADSFKTHFNLFAYVFNYLRELGSFPDWVYSQDGGLWMAPLSNNYLTLVPYRYFGYALAYFQAVPSNVAYKLCFLFLGIPFFLCGLYRFIFQLFHSRPIAWFGLATAFLSSIHLSLFHQEQALATVLFWPWIGSWALRARTDRRYLVGLVFLFGLSLNFHYPHLWVLYVGFTGLWAIALYRPNWRRSISEFRGQRQLLLWTTVGLLVCVGPVLYSYFGYRNQLASEFREQKAGIAAGSFAEYRELNLQQMSSVHPDNFRLYLNLPPGRKDLIAPLDMKSFFLSPFLIVCLVVGLFLRIPLKAFQYGAIGILALLAMGIYGPLAKPLFYLVPGMALFRQWFHFVPLLNLHLLILMLCVLRSISVSRLRPLAGFLAALSLAFGFFWAVHNFYDVRRYTILSPGTHLQDQSGAFARLAVQENRALQYALHANVRGVDLEALRRHTLLGGIYWATSDGVLMKPAMENLRVVEKDGLVSVEWKSKPPLAERLNLLQYNDGRWRIASPNPSLKIDPAETNWLSVRIPGGSGSFSLSRTRTPWLFLVFAMWLPLLFFWGWMAYGNGKFKLRF